jgi:hypothetical protein
MQNNSSFSATASGSGITSPAIVAVLPQSGIDFKLISNRRMHGVLVVLLLQTMLTLQGVSSTSALPVVAVSEHDSRLRVLDIEASKGGPPGQLPSHHQHLVDGEALVVVVNSKNRDDSAKRTTSAIAMTTGSQDQIGL